jgi:signal transduction histidine kinase
LQNYTTLINQCKTTLLPDKPIVKRFWYKKNLLNYLLFSLSIVLTLQVYAQKKMPLPESQLAIAPSIRGSASSSTQPENLSLQSSPLQNTNESIIIKGPYCNDEMEFVHPDNILPANTSWVSFWIANVPGKDSAFVPVEYRLSTTSYTYNWHILSHNREIVFHDLDAGRYSLEVRRKKNNTTNRYDSSTINFEINKAWNEKTGWQLLLFIIFALLLSFFVRLYYSSLIKNKNELESKISERTMQLQNSNKELTKKIAELDAVTQNLTEINRLREQLVNILSHDVHSPLRFSTMIGKAVLTRHEDLNKEEIIDALTDINQTGTQVLILISSILKWVEYQKENYTPIKKVENLSQLVQDKIEFFRFMAGSKNIELINNIPPSILISTDKTGFGVIVQNILNNAIKFTPDGEIDVSAFADDKNITLHISDTGSGLSPESIAAIKKGDVVLPLADTENLKGNGLGWRLIKDLLYRLNGQFEIKSSQGTGTTVSLIFPI